jgi:two-component system, cell cycle response regulator DivK
VSKRILVVEDQEAERGMLRDLLTGSLTGSDTSVIEAVDGATGMAIAKSENPDLILMDIQMLVIDGYEATRRIRADPAIDGIPIIAVSSFAMQGDEEKARSAGRDHYVTKPYSPMQLLKVIRGILGHGVTGCAVRPIATSGTNRRWCARSGDHLVAPFVHGLCRDRATRRPCEEAFHNPAPPGQ